MRLFWDNEIDKAGVVFTPSSQVSTLPASNVAHEFRKKVWRTGTSVAAENLVMDLGSAKAITSVILLDHTLTNADTLIKLEGNSSNSWGSPPFSQALTWASGTIGQAFASQSYRYWRLVFTKSAAGESRDIGRIFLGTYYEFETQPDYDGYDDETVDPSRKQKTVGGQTYTEVLDRYTVPRCDWSGMPTTQAEAVKTIVNTIGQNRSFFLQVDTAAPLATFWYVKLSRALKRKVTGVDADLKWDMALEFEEQL